MEAEKQHKWDSSAKWPEELDALKSILAKTPLFETTKWGGPTYTHKGKNVVGLGAFKNYVGLWFFNGLALKDEAKVLMNAQEGVTKSLRQWRFTSKDEILNFEKEILNYIEEAMNLVDLGIAVKPQRKPEIKSALIEDLCKSDADFTNAISKLTPGKKREYLEYVESAKREETKIARLEKIRPMILSGAGLNDKYKK